MINRFTALGLREPATDAALDEIDAFFREAGTRYAIGVDPLPEPETSLRVEEIGREHGVAFGSVVARGYGMPDSLAGWFAGAAALPRFRLFLAFDGDEPAGAGALFVGDGIGWLGLAATVPEHRRKGAQSAILAARIRAAGEAGLGQ